MIRAIAILLLVASCGPVGSRPVSIASTRPEPPFKGCLQKPPPLPPIATGAQVKARHDQLDRLYDDCAERLRRNLESAG